MILNNKILTKTGYKDIKDLKVGDIVLSFNADKNINEYNKILNVFVNKVDKLYEIKINNKRICVSGEHPFYNGKDYIEAKDLKINDMVFTNEFKLEKIYEINEISNDELLYNIEVENNHNYYVEGYLVHNYGATGSHNSPGAVLGGGGHSSGGGGMLSPGVVLGGGGHSSGGRSGSSHGGGNSPYAGNPGYVGGGYVEPLKQMPNGRWVPQSEYDKKMGEITKHQAEITELNKEAKILNELNDTAMNLEREWRQSGTDIQTFLTQAGVPLKDRSTIIECMNNAGRTGNNTNKRLIEIGEKRTKLENDIISKDGKIDNTKNPKISDSYRPANTSHSVSEIGVNPKQTIKYDPKSAQSAIDAAKRLLDKASKFEEASDKYRGYSKGTAKGDKVNVKNGTSITKAGTNLVSALTTIQGEFEKSSGMGNSDIKGLGNDIGKLGGYPSSRGSTPGVVDFSGGRSGSKSGSSTPSAINYGSDPRYTNTGNPGLYLGGSGNSTSKPSSNQGKSSPKSTSPATTGGGGTFLGGGGNTSYTPNLDFNVSELEDLANRYADIAQTNTDIQRRNTATTLVGGERLLNGLGNAIEEVVDGALAALSNPIINQVYSAGLRGMGATSKNPLVGTVANIASNIVTAINPKTYIDAAGKDYSGAIGEKVYTTNAMSNLEKSSYYSHDSSIMQKVQSAGTNVSEYGLEIGAAAIGAYAGGSIGAKVAATATGGLIGAGKSVEQQYATGSIDHTEIFVSAIEGAAEGNAIGGGFTLIGAEAAGVKSLPKILKGSFLSSDNLMQVAGTTARNIKDGFNPGKEGIDAIFEYGTDVLGEVIAAKNPAVGLGFKIYDSLADAGVIESIPFVGDSKIADLKIWG